MGEAVKRVEVAEAVNPMRIPRVEKVVVNIALGKSGEPLERAKTILSQVTNGKPYTAKAKTTIRDFGIHKGEPIACIVTLRREKAMEFLRKSLEAVGKKVPLRSFDKYGNFSFGIKEHLLLPGTRYNPELGTVGMDVAVTLTRPGFRVARKRRGTKVGVKHRLSREEAVEFVRGNFGVEVFGD